MRSAPRRAGWLFCLAVLAFPLLFQGTRGLFESDEGRYAEVAREMLATHDWLVPRLAGQPHFTKPPLTYWLTALGLSAAGRNAWGARLPLGLASGATALLCGLIARRLWGVGAFRTGAVLFLLALAPFVGGSVLTTDMFLTLWETAGVLCFLEAWAGGSRRHLWAAGLGAAFGFAFLTKGPPGLLPLGAIVAFAGWRGAGRRGRLGSPWGVLAGLAIGLGWYAAVVARTPGLGRYFLGDEVYARVFTSEHHRHNPWLIHPATLIAGFLPWTAVLPSFVTGGWRGTARRVTDRLRRPGDDRVRFLLLWVGIPLAVFLTARSRLPLYTLPLFVPLSAGAAGLLQGGTKTTGGAWPDSPTVGAAPAGPSRAFWRFACVWAGALLALKAVAGLAVPWSQDMRALDAAARALAPGPSRVITLGDEPLHGLRFYRDGELTAWNGGPPRPPGAPAERMVDVIARVRAEAAADGVPRLFVLSTKVHWADGDLALARLAPAAIVGGRALYLVAPPAQPSAPQSVGSAQDRHDAAAADIPPH